MRDDGMRPVVIMLVHRPYDTLIHSEDHMTVLTRMTVSLTIMPLRAAATIQEKQQKLDYLEKIINCVGICLGGERA